MIPRWKLLVAGVALLAVALSGWYALIGGGLAYPGLSGVAAGSRGLVLDPEPR